MAAIIPDSVSLKNVVGGLVKCVNGHNAWVQILGKSPSHTDFRCTQCGEEVSLPLGYVASVRPAMDVDDLLRQIADLVAENKRLADENEALRGQLES